MVFQILCLIVITDGKNNCTISATEIPVEQMGTDLNQVQINDLTNRKKLKESAPEVHTFSS